MLRFLIYNQILSLLGSNEPKVCIDLALLLSLDNVIPVGGFCIPNSLIAYFTNCFIVCDLSLFRLFKPSFNDCNFALAICLSYLFDISITPCRYSFISSVIGIISYDIFVPII